MSMQLIERDLRHIWHPCAQMKDFELCPPLVVEKAQGSMLYTDKGPLIDGISSWWCKSLGHGHPVVRAAIEDQLTRFEHVIGANTTHEFLVQFGEKMHEISGLQRVFFASDGSSAVEIAMKMALHANQLLGKAQCNEFLALENSYHGETLGTLSVSDLGLFKAPYTGYGVKCHFIKSLPYVSGNSDLKWADAEEDWLRLLPQLEQVKSRLCALLVEPLIQGAGGMRCYSADFLQRLAGWAKQNDIYLIADEIMTGIGRTGQWLACQHAKVQADFVCLSKGLTSGSIPFSCVLVDNPIYELFYDDYAKGKSFLHSHTFSANALAIRAALATIEVMEKEQINQRVAKLSTLLQQHWQEIAQLTGKLEGLRGFGAMVAAELSDCSEKRLGFLLQQEAQERGALLRPMGNTVYWLPPLNISEEEVTNLAEITLNSIKAVYNKQ